MTIDPKLLELLCCPLSRVPLELLAKDRLQTLNQQIAEGRIHQFDGTVVSEPLQEALVTCDGKRIYPVRDDIPVMLAQEAIDARPLDSP
ncbi:MAG: Trm112 family protein [Gammaproteobacteria bacterium]